MNWLNNHLSVLETAHSGKVNFPFETQGYKPLAVSFVSQCIWKSIYVYLSINFKHVKFILIEEINNKNKKFNNVNLRYTYFVFRY